MMTSVPPTVCPSCGSAASGRFCANCGAPLTASTCRSCDAELTPGAKFCQSCGAPAGASALIQRPRGGSGQLPWIVAAVALLAVFGMLAGRSFGARRAAAPEGPVSAANVPGDESQQGRAPDISNLSPEERADRLFNRVMLLNSQGKTDSVQFFAPMAFTAYQMLPTLDADQRYDMGRIAEVAGALPFAKAQSDSILQKNPSHLLGLVLAARVAAIAGDKNDLHGVEKKLLSVEKSELAKNLAEYERHMNDITTAIAAARRDLGAA